MPSDQSMKTKSLKPLKLCSLKTFSDEELREELKRRDEFSIKINGITTSDFVVDYADWVIPPGHKEFRPTFAFFIKHKKKKYCIYNDYNYENPQKWWPTHKRWEDDVVNGAMAFIPRGFYEVCENTYEYDGTTEEAIEKLKLSGFKTINNVQNKTGV